MEKKIGRTRIIKDDEHHMRCGQCGRYWYAPEDESLNTCPQCWRKIYYDMPNVPKYSLTRMTNE